MKKILIAMLGFGTFPLGLLAQDTKEKIEKQERIEKKENAETPEIKETQEIIIRKKGGAENLNLKVEINGDDIKVNGKPLSEFRDKDITINKRKMTITDGDHQMHFDFSPGNEGMENLDEDFAENFTQGWNAEDNSKGAFLGVTTEAAAGGVKVTQVIKGSAAEKAGLKKDDIITKAGDEKITSPEALSDVISLKKPKDEVKVAYKRNGKETTVKTILGNKKQSRKMIYSFNSPDGSVRSFSMPKIAPNINMDGLNDDIFGMQQNAMENVFPRQKKLGLKIQDVEEGSGVKVINVEDSSAAAAAGIKKDDIITEINGTKIESTDDAREKLVPDEDKKVYRIKLDRAGTEMNFDIKIPKKLKTANL